MSWVDALLVAGGGAAGAVARHLVALGTSRLRAYGFPVGTWLVNVIGSLLLGIVAGAVAGDGAPGWLLALVGTGLCGALTTFSTFSHELIMLVRERRWPVATAYLVGSLVVGWAACAVGWWLVGGPT
ncbi:fluoride efflux transporter CrcB [Propionibacteriaceae bacterium Y2011]|uniref:fluoride efflux transporter CrcB n=1 Tax=Microlunatus sp. Y2014 TaxID=3418488 RepID=UPI003B45D47C